MLKNIIANGGQRALVCSINEIAHRWKLFDQNLTKMKTMGFKLDEATKKLLDGIKEKLEAASSYVASYQGANLVLNKFPEAKTMASKAASKREWDTVCSKLPFATPLAEMTAWIVEHLPATKSAGKTAKRPPSQKRRTNEPEQRDVQFLRTGDKHAASA
jgi:hypothetical protein